MTGFKPLMKIKGREGNQDTSTRVSLGSYFFATHRKMCEPPIIFSTLLNAAEYVVMAFNERCPEWQSCSEVAKACN